MKPSAADIEIGNRRAVRDGDIKLVKKNESGKKQEWLFDLASDTAEQGGLISGRDRERLNTMLAEWEAEMDGKPSR